MVRGILLTLFLIGSIDAVAQDSTLLNMLSDSMKVSEKRSFVSASFKGSNVINLQTVEQPAKHVLLFMIMHRFGRLNDGAYNFFGLDNAVLRMGLTYGITSGFSITVGRSSLDKALDGSIKFKIFRQAEKGGSPVSVSCFTSFVYPTIKYTDKPYVDSKLRPIYTHQLIVARKISQQFSMEVVPTYIHFNLVEKAADKNDVFVLGTGARYKLTRRMSLNAEYDILPGGQLHTADLKNSFSLGVDMETGGHVFQLVFTNSQGMVEPYYLAKTTGSWGKGDIYFGFNISRVFNLKKK